MQGPKKRDRAPKETHPVPTPPKPVRRIAVWVPLAVLCALTLLAYVNSFSSGFVMDNRGILLEDPRIREATSQNLAAIFQHTYWWPYGESGLYRPFTTLTYLFNYAILGNANHPAGYHWINFLLHAGNVLLVFALARKLSRQLWPAFGVAALWAVHPVLTESVTNIVGRADLLAAMAVLSGFLMYLKGTEASDWRRWGWLGGLLAVTLMGVFSKESAAVILGIIVIYEVVWWRERRQGKALALGSVTVLLALEAMAYARGAVFHRLPPTQFPYLDNPLVEAPFWTAKLTALKILAKYLGLLFWPAHLSSDYSYSQIPVISGTPGDWLAWLMVAAAIAVAAYAYRLHREVFFALCAGALWFLPSANLLFPIGTIMADRFLYLPAIATSACIVAVCYALGRRFRQAKLAPILLSVLMVACVLRTWARNADWQDPLSFTQAAVETAPNSYKSHKMLAASLFEADSAHTNIDAVIAEAEKGIALLSTVPDHLNNPDTFRLAGGYYFTKGDLLLTRSADGRLTPSDASVAAYKKALDLLLRTRQIAKAQFDYLAAKDRALGYPGLQPDETKLADLERAISATYVRLGDTGSATEAGAKAQQMEPSKPEGYRQLSDSYWASGKPDDAAVTLIVGSLVTSDIGLRQQLLKLYAAGLDTEGCATKPGPYGPQINNACGIVRKHFCAAAAQTRDLYSRMGRKDLLEQLVPMAAAEFGCKPE